MSLDKVLSPEMYSSGCQPDGVNTLQKQNTAISNHSMTTHRFKYLATLQGTVQSMQLQRRRRRAASQAVSH